MCVCDGDGESCAGGRLLNMMQVCVCCVCVCDDDGESCAGGRLLNMMQVCGCVGVCMWVCV